MQRFDAVPQYFYAKASLSRTQPLPYGAQLFARVEGQIADGSLLSSEQLSAGGASTVRGYLEAERLGDNGVRSSLELRSPPLEPPNFSLLKDWRVLAFYDSAKLWLNNPLPGEQDSFSLASTGIGTRFTMLDYLTGSLDLAFPLVSGSTTHTGDPYLHFRFSAGL